MTTKKVQDEEGPRADIIGALKTTQHEGGHDDDSSDINVMIFDSMAIV